MQRPFLKAIFLDGLSAALVRMLWAAFLVLANPFGLNSWSDANNRAIWQNFYAPFYPCKAQLGFLTLAETQGLANAGCGEPLTNVLKAPSDAEVIAAAKQRAGLSRITVITHNDAVSRAGEVSYNTPALKPGQLVELFRQLPVPQPPVPGLEDSALPGPPPLALFLDFWPATDLPAPDPAQLLVPTEANCSPATNDRAALSLCLARSVAAATRYGKWRDNRNCQRNPAIKLRCIISAGGVPVLIAFPRTGDSSGAEPATDGIAKLLGEAALLVNIVLGDGEISMIDEAGRDTRNENWTLSAPAALYLAACLQSDLQHNKGAPPSCGPIASWREVPDDRLEVVGWPEQLHRPIAPVAGLHPESPADALLAAVESGNINNRCVTANAARTKLLDHIARVALPDMISANLPLCPPNDELQMATLERAGGAAGATMRREMLGGRLLLVGDNRSLSSDRHELPPFSQLAGVFVLAMATDNLLERGGDYATKQTKTNELGSTVLAVFCVGMMAGTLVTLLKLVGKNRFVISALLAVLLPMVMLGLWLWWGNPLSATGFNEVLVLLFLLEGTFEVYRAVLVQSVSRWFGREETTP